MLGPVWSAAPFRPFCGGATCWDRADFLSGAGVRPATWHTAPQGRGRAVATIMPSFCEAVLSYLSRQIAQSLDCVTSGEGLDSCSNSSTRTCCVRPAPLPRPRLARGSVGVSAVDARWSRRLSMLRDDTTEAWRARFLAPMRVDRPARVAHGREQPSRTLATSGRFLRKAPDAPVSLPDPRAMTDVSLIAPGVLRAGFGLPALGRCRPRSHGEMTTRTPETGRRRCRHGAVKRETGACQGGRCLVPASPYAPSAAGGGTGGCGHHGGKHACPVWRWRQNSRVGHPTPDAPMCRTPSVAPDQCATRRAVRS